MPSGSRRTSLCSLSVKVEKGLLQELKEAQQHGPGSPPEAAPKPFFRDMEAAHTTSGGRRGTRRAVAAASPTVPLPSGGRRPSGWGTLSVHPAHRRVLCRYLREHPINHLVAEPGTDLTPRSSHLLPAVQNLLGTGRPRFISERPRELMIVIGIDPGLAIVGYACWAGRAPGPAMPMTASARSARR